MSHITIIISKVAGSTGNLEAEVSYEYRIPVPHEATPRTVGRLVERAYEYLEGHVVSGRGSSDE